MSSTAVLRLFSVCARVPAWYPARRLALVVLNYIPLAQSPSLQLLRLRHKRRFVRRLLWYYATVRLPLVVHQRLSSLTSRCVPWSYFGHGRHSDLAVPNQYVSAHARGLRPRGVDTALASNAPYLPCCLRRPPRNSALRF